MATAMIVNAAFLIPMAISLADLAKQKANNKFTSTNVELVAGHGSSDAGGAIPDVSLFDVNGARIGQWKAKGKKLGAGDSTTDKQPTQISILENQGTDGQPQYVMLTMANDDAICLTSVAVDGHGVQWAWMGDVAYHCGADWYQSNYAYGNDNYMPKCGWLDKNHSDGLHYVGMSLHMSDFNGDSGLLKEYNDKKDNLCNSKARYNRIGDFEKGEDADNAFPYFFSPPLQYNKDGSDKDEKAIFKPGKVNAKRDAPAAPVNATMNGSIDRLGHVVISEYKAHSATELCESSTSRGPSFVAIEEGMYCDMSTKKPHPVCAQGVTTACFDTDNNRLLSQPRRRHARDLETRDIHKQYITSETWGPTRRKRV